MINFVSLWETIEVSCIFEASVGVLKIGSSLKSDHQVRLNLSKSFDHMVAEIEGIKQSILRSHFNVRSSWWGFYINFFLFFNILKNLFSLCKIIITYHSCFPQLVYVYRELTFFTMSLLTHDSYFINNWWKCNNILYN